MNSGSCLCGDVRWRIDGDIVMASDCHCRMCQKFHGMGFGRYVAVAADDFEFLAGENAVARYESSSGSYRTFCPRCGSAVAARSADGNLAFMPAGCLSGDLKAPLQGHIFTASVPPWDRITDDAPQYDAYPPQYDMPAQPDMHRPAETAGAIGGSCLCNAVAFEVTAVMPRFGHCHCSRCRKSRGAPHSTQVFAYLDAFRWRRGNDHLVGYSLPEAEHFHVDFCRTCASPMPTLMTDAGLVMIPAGCLDHDPGQRPRAHIYVGSKASWFEILDDLPQFDTAPPMA